MSLIKRSIQLVSFMFLLTAANVYADSWNCSKSDLVREVVVEYAEGGVMPCTVVYKKQTEGFGDQELWAANNEQGYCEQKAREFVAKLESWGWVCMETVGTQGGDSM